MDVGVFGGIVVVKDAWGPAKPGGSLLLCTLHQGVDRGAWDKPANQNIAFAPVVRDLFFGEHVGIFRYSREHVFARFAHSLLIF